MVATGWGGRLSWWRWNGEAGGGERQCVGALCECRSAWGVLELGPESSPSALHRWAGQLPGFQMEEGGQGRPRAQAPFTRLRAQHTVLQAGSGPSPGLCMGSPGLQLRS